MVTALTADSDLFDFIASRTAIIEPLYAKFMKTGLPVNDWKRWEDHETRPTDDIGPDGLVWKVKTADYGKTVYFIYRDRAPEGEDRYEYTPKGWEKTYMSQAAADKAAARKNKAAAN
jgi:hypothetical protein